jgi:hypothetical protein
METTQTVKRQEEWPPADSDIGISLRQIAALERIADALERLVNGSWYADPHDYGSWQVENRG